MEWLNLRRIAIFSTLAAVVSILSAGISGVPFLALLLRAVISAAAFGVLIAAASWALYKFTPDLFDPEGMEHQNEPVTGDQINVMVDDAVQTLSDTGNRDSSAGTGPSVQVAGNGDTVNPADAEFAEEGTEKKKPVKWNVEQEDFSEGGKLPDIESFSSDFQSDEKSSDDDNFSDNEQSRSASISESPVSGGLSSGPVNSDDEARDYFTKNSSPEEMAKAVRTVVKRDEE